MVLAMTVANWVVTSWITTSMPEQVVSLKDWKINTIPEEGQWYLHPRYRNVGSDKRDYLRLWLSRWWQPAGMNHTGGRI